MRGVIPYLVVCGFIILLYQPGAQATGSEGDPVASAPGWFITQKKKEKGKYDPPKAFPPSEETLQQIKGKTALLAAKIAELRKDKKHHELLPDVEIYLRGAQNMLRFQEEFYSKDSAKWTLDALDRGLQRAEQLGKGETPWTKLATRNVLRAYRSVIDGTTQPYGVTYPLDYGKDPKRKWRVDIVLHGRNGTLTEVSFLNTHNGTKKPAADQDWVQIDIFGRGNNAYRWAGESDVFEAFGALLKAEYREGRRDLVDHRRVVLRGFSMGGAGTWHLGLHYPTFWRVMGPGAGFTTTHDYAWKGKKELPDYQEKCLHIYDAIDYVENARTIPIVAYSGGDDPQKLAADNIERRLQDLKINTMTHLVAPGLGHTFPADWFKKANALWSEKAAKSRPLISNKAEFVTYTLKYPFGDGISIGGLHRHYEKAFVRIDRSKSQVITQNIRKFSVTLGDHDFVTIDGQKIELGSHAFIASFTQEEGKWKRIPPPDLDDPFDVDKFLDQLRDRVKEFKKNPQKSLGLTGPIDDAFASGFVCVLGSGDTWHPATQKFVDAKVKAFTYDWAKHWRGELPTTGDYAVTPNDIKDKHLVLFGDPSSNLTLAQILPKLPLKWTKDEIEFDGKKYKSSEHVPVMIFPNPLNPLKYVVLNTGHTIPSEDYTKTNALLFPRLGDYAILRMTPTAKNAAAYEVATAGLFNEFWQVEKK